MQLSCLLNSVDTFKGTLLRLLMAYELLRDMAVDPLISDPDLWDSEAYQVYSTLMGISLRSDQPRSVLQEGSRRLPGIPGHSGDIFLDPSTGVVYGRQGRRNVERYVFPEEIRALLSPSNVVCIYQAWPQRGVRDAALEAIQVVVQPRGSLAAVTCDRGKTSMIFFSRDFSRIDCIAAWLRRWMGPGSNRILSFPD